MNIKVAIILGKGNQAVSEKLLKNVQVSLYKEGILLKYGSPMFEPMAESLIYQLSDISTNCKTPLINGIIMAYELDEAMKIAENYTMKKIGKSLLDIIHLERNITV